MLVALGLHAHHSATLPNPSSGAPTAGQQAWAGGTRYSPSGFAACGRRLICPLVERPFPGVEFGDAGVVSGGQEPRLFGGEEAAAVFGFVMACDGAGMSTLFG